MNAGAESAESGRQENTELEERAAKLSNVQWRPDHRSYIADCPLSNGKIHRLADSSARTACLGGCSKDAIAKFFANDAEPSKGDRTSWRLKLQELGGQ